MFSELWLQSVYCLVFLKPDTSVCLPCAHLSEYFSLLYMSSLSGSRTCLVTSLCFLNTLLKQYLSLPSNESTLQLQGHSWVGSWHSQILHQKQSSVWLLCLHVPNRFGENVGETTNSWWMDDGCSGTICLVSVMNLFHLIRHMEPIGSDTLQIALYYIFLMYFCCGYSWSMQQTIWLKLKRLNQSTVQKQSWIIPNCIGNRPCQFLLTFRKKPILIKFNTLYHFSPDHIYEWFLYMYKCVDMIFGMYCSGEHAQSKSLLKRTIINH